jgi:hypothetical protein
MTAKDRRAARRLKFGAVLRVLRARQQLTPAELAALVDWPTWRVEMIELGDGESLTKAEALELAEALDIDPRLLMVAYPDGEGKRRE